MTTVRWTMIVFGLALVASQALLTDRSWAGKCYADWSEAGPLVRAEALTPVADVLAAVAKQHKGKAVKIKLCRKEGGYIYKLAISRSGGQITWVTVDAKSGRISSLAQH